MTSPTAPADVLDQGFACEVSWWRRYIKDDRWWPEALDALPTHPDRPGYQRITRQDVFNLAADPTLTGRVGLLLAAYIWGTGDGGFLVGRRARVFTKTDIAVVGERLVAAVAVMEQDGPVAAYDRLLARQPLHVKYLGPAFYTKFLYFAAGQPPRISPQPLILDRYVARALTNHHGMPLRGTGWSSADYSRYLNYATNLAQQAATSPDAIELALYTS